MIDSIPQVDRAVLTAGLQAPSAHNTQPWLVEQTEDPNTYKLYHRLDGNLPEPQGLISYLNSGALVRTLELAAPQYGRVVETTPVLERREAGLYIAQIAIRALREGEPIDPLSAHVAGRVTNRNRYDAGRPMTPELANTLRGLGNTLLSPKKLSHLVMDAGVEAWADPRFVEDLLVWSRTSNEAADGITPGPFNLPPGTQFLLRLAARRGGFRGIMGRLMAAKDVMAFNNAPVAAVLGADGDTPQALYDAGKRLVDSWVAITGSGYDYQPFSGPVFYDSTRPGVAAVSEQPYPVALYRIGVATKPQKIASNRKSLEEVLIG